MPRPLLPPSGVYVPAQLINHPQLPPAALLTWIQLRGLALGGQVTPPITVHELSTLTGKSPATLHRHLNQLKARSTLSWRSGGQGSIVFSFHETQFESLQDPGSPVPILDSQKREPGVPCSPGLDALNRDLPILKNENQGRSIPLIPILKIVDSPSLNPLNYSSMIPVFKKDFKESESIKVNLLRVEGEEECEGERDFSNLRSHASGIPPPAICFRSNSAALPGKPTVLG